MEATSQNKFAYPLTVTAADIDEMGHANNVVYLRWVQEASTAHWDHIATDLLKKTCAWVVVRHEIDYLHPALINDPLIAYTWVGEHNGAKSVRYVDVFHAGSNQKLASAKTTWCLLDTVTLRPKRIDAATLAVFK